MTYDGINEMMQEIGMPYLSLPELMKLWGMNLETQVESKKTSPA